MKKYLTPLLFILFSMSYSHLYAQSSNTSKNSSNKSTSSEWGQFGCDLGNYYIKRVPLTQKEQETSNFYDRPAMYKIVMPEMYTTGVINYAESLIDRSRINEGILKEQVYFYEATYNNGVSPRFISVYVYKIINEDPTPKMYQMEHAIYGKKNMQVILDGKNMTGNGQILYPPHELISAKDLYVNVLNNDKIGSEIVLSKCDAFDTPIINTEKNDEITVLMEKQSSATTFKIKDFEIGKTLKESCDKFNTLAEYKGKVFQYCNLETSIFETPFIADIVLLDGKIIKVQLNAKKIPNKGGNVLYDSINISDMSAFTNDLIVRIKESLGEPIIKKERKSGFAEYENENAKTKPADACNISSLNAWQRQTCSVRMQIDSSETRAKLRKQCGKCNIDTYTATWSGKYKVKLISMVPEIQDSPGAFKGISIEYTIPSIEKYANDFLTEKINSRKEEEKRIYQQFRAEIKQQKEGAINKQKRDF